LSGKGFAIQTDLNFARFSTINIILLATIAASEEIPQGPFILLEHVICYGVLFAVFVFSF